MFSSYFFNGIFYLILGIREMCALGLIGKLVTGPWMKKFYVAPVLVWHPSDQKCLRCTC